MKALVAALAVLMPVPVFAAALEGEAQRQPINWVAILMFVAFVGLTLWITKAAAARTRTASDFYTAGGGITGFQNGLAMAGDY
ncbi:MAG: cation acetate symporter, partial [Pseudomonadota bacterium]|nr:cation acetate symporter [Pseudomonadota bacterium]